MNCKNEINKKMPSEDRTQFSIDTLNYTLENMGSCIM